MFDRILNNIRGELIMVQRDMDTITADSFRRVLCILFCVVLQSCPQANDNMDNEFQNTLFALPRISLVTDILETFVPRF